MPPWQLLRPELPSASVPRTSVVLPTVALARDASLQPHVRASLLPIWHAIQLPPFRSSQASLRAFFPLLQASLVLPSVSAPQVAFLIRVPFDAVFPPRLVEGAVSPPLPDVPALIVCVALRFLHRVLLWQLLRPVFAPLALFLWLVALARPFIALPPSPQLSSELPARLRVLLLPLL